jgi:hypothetical protein
VPRPGSPAQAVAGQLDPLEKGIVMSIYVECALAVLAFVALAIPLLGVRFIARLDG